MKLIRPGNIELQQRIFFLSAGVLPFSTSVSVVLLALAAIIKLWRGKSGNSGNSSLTYILAALPSGYFLTRLAALLYTTDLSNGLLDLESKLSFLAFPIIFLALRPTEAEIENIKKYFVFGCISAVIYCLSFSLITFFESGSWNAFIYDSFSRLMHPSYFALYLNLAALFALGTLGKNYKTSEIVLCFGILATGVILSASKMGIAIFLASVLFSIFRILKSGRINTTQPIIALGGILVVAFVIVIAGNPRFQKLWNEIKDTQIGLNTDQKSYFILSTRLQLWDAALEVIKDNPLIGVSPGDAQAELIRVYEEKEYSRLAIQRYMPHNQYLQTAVATGIPGSLFLLAMFIIPAYLLRNSGAGKIFIILVASHCLVESVLEIEKGIVFFNFMYCTLFLSPTFLVKNQ